MELLFLINTFISKLNNGLFIPSGIYPSPKAITADEQASTLHTETK